MEKIVGFVVLGMVRGSMMVMSIAVDGGYRRRGGCSALLRHVQSYTSALDLHVKVDNLQAIRCYEKNGFRTVRRVPGYYHSLGGMDAYLMRWVAGTNGSS